MERHFLSMNPPCTFCIFPDKKFADPQTVYSVNHKDPVRESFCQGNCTTGGTDVELIN